MRALRVAAPCQLPLLVPGHCAWDRWNGLPDEVRRNVLALLARLIARGVVAEDDPTSVGAAAGVADGC